MATDKFFTGQSGPDALKALNELFLLVQTMAGNSGGTGLSAADRIKLDGIAAQATKNQTDAYLLNRGNHTNTQSADTITDGVTNKVYTATEKTKLGGIAANATQNSSDAALKNRQNHTGEQLISTVTGLQTALDNKQPATVFKTINGQAITGGPGDIQIVGGGSGGAVSSVAGKTGIVTLAKADVGLANVDNTPDASKPVSNAVQLALNNKQDKLVANETLRLINGQTLLGGGNLVIGTTETKQTLTLANPVIWNSTLGKIAEITLTAPNQPISLPTNLVPGWYSLIVNQDSVGGRFLNWANGYNISPDLYLSTEGNKQDVLFFMSTGTELFCESMFKGKTINGGNVVQPPVSATPPEKAFENNTNGFWINPSIISNFITTAAGTTAITAYDQTYVKLLDSSPNKNNMSTRADNLQNTAKNNNGLYSAQSYAGYSGANAGGSTTGFYFCMAFSAPIYEATLFSDVNTVNTGLKFRRNGSDVDDLTFSVGTGSTRVSISFNSGTTLYNNMAGKHVFEAWLEGGQLVGRLNGGATKSVACSAIAAGKTAFVVGAVDNIDTDAALVMDVYQAIFTKNNSQTAVIRNAIGKYCADQGGISYATTTTPTTPTQKTFALYYLAYSNRYPITAVPLKYNKIYLFRAVGNGGVPDTNNNGNGGFIFIDDWNVSKAQIQQCRARGQQVHMSIGGSRNGYSFTNRTQSQNFIDSFQAMYDAYGPFDGCDFNHFEAGIESSISEMIWIATELRRRFGAKFEITAPPAPNADYDKNLLVAMKNAGVLNNAAPQFYGYSGIKEPNYIRGRITTWVNLMGGDASKVLVGFNAAFGGDVNSVNSATEEECVREWNLIKQDHPNIGGMFAWSHESILSDPRGADHWGNTMYPLL